MKTEEITNRFTAYQTPSVIKEKSIIIRSKAINLAILIDYYCPDSREKSISLTKLEECIMWANKCLSKETIDDEKNSDKVEPKSQIDYSLVSGMII